MPIHRYRISAAFAVILCALSSSCSAPDDRGAGEAFRALAREQSLAESYVLLLKRFGEDDARRYADGIRLYAQARADFDGLIAQMTHDITHREPFERSEDFQAVLERAVERRVAFTHHVDATLEAMTNGTRTGVKDYIGSAGELVSIIKGAASAIWEKYWSLEETEHKETLVQLEALKWKPFHAIGDSRHYPQGGLSVD